MRIGTRGSALALAQARLVAGLLEAHLAASPAAEATSVELVTIATTGDRNSAAPDSAIELPTIATAGERSTGARHPTGGGGDERSGESREDDGFGDKSRWVLELEQALTAGAIDLAVHSAKDVPGELAEGLALLGAPGRAPAEDVLCLAGRSRVTPADPGAPQAGLERLSPGARVGTSSVRRAAQLRGVREDLEVVAVRGNVDTRLRKLGEGGYDALVLARAGLQRLGREREIAAVLDPTRFVPSPGQGTLALEGRADDEVTRAAVQAITDAKTLACLRAERAVAHALGASCNTPLGAHAVDYGCGCLHLRAWVGLPDGSAWVGDELLAETGTDWGDTRSARIPKSASAGGACHPASVGFYDPEQLGVRVAERLLSAGADELLRRAEELASHESAIPAQPTSPA